MRAPVASKIAYSTQDSPRPEEQQVARSAVRLNRAIDRALGRARHDDLRNRDLFARLEWFWTRASQVLPRIDMALRDQRPA
jgi:hypothetical protein